MTGKETNIVYIQADARYNSFLLYNVDGNNVIGHIIEACKGIVAAKIVWGGYECPENQSLEQEMRIRGVDIITNNEQDVNKRFVDIVCSLDFSGYVIRVCGDQLLIDIKTTNSILNEMRRDDIDWFYEKTVSAVVPDIVKISVLKENRESLREMNRYFDLMPRIARLKRKYLVYGMVPIACRANSNEGYRVCKYILENKINPEELMKELCIKLQNPKGFLSASGLLGSWALGWDKDFFWDEEQNLNSWWPNSAVIFVRAKLKKEMRVFEYGCGNSTFFFANNVHEVVAVEHDYDWYQRVKGIAPSNVKLLFRELDYGGDYSKTASSEGLFDVISIDGRDRINCAYNSIQSLKQDGIILWDDSERTKYQTGFDFLNNQGFSRLDFEGVIYGSPEWSQRITVFYRKGNNCFDL